MSCECSLWKQEGGLSCFWRIFPVSMILGIIMRRLINFWIHCFCAMNPWYLPPFPPSFYYQMLPELACSHAHKRLHIHANISLSIDIRFKFFAAIIWVWCASWWSSCWPDKKSCYLRDGFVEAWLTPGLSCCF